MNDSNKDISRLVEELNHQKKELKESENRLILQYSISQVLVYSETLEGATRKIIEIICENFGWKCGAFWQPDLENKKLECISYWQDPKIANHEFESITRFTYFLKGTGLPGRIWKKNESLWAADLAGDPSFQRAQMAAKIGINSFFGFPIRINDTVIGVIEFFSDVIPEPETNLKHLLGATANQIAQFIQKINANTTLQQSEKTFKQLVEEASDIIYRTNNKGFFTYVNPIAARIMKMKDTEIIGKHFRELIREDYRRKADLFYKKQFITKTAFTYFEFPVVNSDMSELWLGQNVKIMFQGGKIAGFLAVARNITDRKRSEQQLLHAKEVAERSKKVKEQFLANMSHEIRTPMNAIMGMTDILKETKLSPDQKECIDAIKLSADNLLAIINDILDFSKIEAGKVTFENFPFKLEEVIEGIKQTLHFTAIKKNISLNYFIDPDVPAFIVGDKVKLRQILLNLAHNSVKFTAAGNVNISVELIEKKDNFYSLLFSVTDTGIGIETEKLSGIFESFTQASSETTRKYGGTGLGLTIAKQLVELQDGKISVSSEVNKGSCFSFQLKFKEVESDTLQLSEGIKKSFHGLDDLSVLLVEDNLMNQLVAKKILTKWNCKVDVAENGKIAIEALLRSDHDIILMDIQMPEMDGYETTQHIRKELHSKISRIPIIAMTAHALLGEAEKCISCGMNDYISKPFDQIILYEKILKLTSKKDHKQ